MIPEAQKPTNDVIDFLTDACQTIEIVDMEDGTQQKQLVLNPKKVWYKTQIVNSNTFGRFAYELETFYSKAIECSNFMTRKRAEIMSRQINGIVDNFMYSIDAKSSECLRDKNNTQSTLIDKLSRNKIEKQYTLKEEAKKTFWQGLTGNDGRHESEE